MGWFKAAMHWVRKLPVARLIKPLWKAGLVEIVESAGDGLQKETKEIVAAQGPAALGKINKRIDDWQASVIRKIKALPLPEGIENKVAGWVQSSGDLLQVRLARALESEAPAAAIDQAFDVSQGELIKRIQSL